MPEPEDPAARLETRALALLARREYTRAELGRRLARILSQRQPTVANTGADRLADEFAPPPPRRSGTGWPAGGVHRSSHGSECDEAQDDDPDGAPAALKSLHARLIATVLDRLEAKRLLSDQRAAEAIVHLRRRQRGMLRIAHELEQKGVPPGIASVAMQGLGEAQLPAAREVWRKRFGGLPVNAGDRARQTRFLAARGFSFDVIRAVLGGETED